LIQGLKKFDEDDYQWYKIENKEREDIPIELFLYAILSNQKYGDSISFDELHFGFNSVGNIFALSSRGILDKINCLVEKYDFITFTDDAGIRELQFKLKPDKWKILKAYYER